MNHWYTLLIFLCVLHLIFVIPGTAWAYRHPDAPTDDAFIHRLCPGDGGSSSWRDGARRVGRLPLPSPGQCGCGPDQPAQQRVGVRNDLSLVWLHDNLIQLIICSLRRLFVQQCCCSAPSYILWLCCPLQAGGTVGALHEGSSAPGFLPPPGQGSD